MDDILDLSQDSSDAEIANMHATAISHRKKMKYSQPKCKGLLINGKKHDLLPSMFLNWEKIKHVSSTKYVGDIFQQNGKNDELIRDRLNRGMKVILKIDAILSETQFGKHTIDVSLLLYRYLYLSSVIFNSQA